MPKMLDRFYYIAMSLSFVYFLVKPTKVSFLNLAFTIFALYFMMTMQFISLFSAAFGVIAVVAAAANIGLILYTMRKDYYLKLLKVSKDDSSNKKEA